MFISEDGTVTGSIDHSKLGDVKPKTDEARAQLDAIKAENEAGQEQAAADAERVAEVSRRQHEQLHGKPADADADDDEKPRADQHGDDAKPDETAELEQARGDAEAAGVAVDRRWGVDRLRAETATAKTRKR